MPYLNGAQATIATLRAHDVEVIFGIPGVHTLPIYDALFDEPSLRHVLARHEQGVGFMADGYARASGRPGVACTITGPGVTNIATPIASAYADSIPLLVISSSLPLSTRGRSTGALHEVKNQFAAMEALAGGSRAVSFVEEIPEALREVFRLFRFGRARAAYLEIPLDLLQAKANVAIPAPAASERPRPSADAIARAAGLLRGAKHPLIVAGAGVTMAGANEQVARLAELLQAPVLLGSKSHDVLPSHHPLVITSTGYEPVPELLDLIRGSDVALVVGSKLGAEHTSDGKLPLPATLLQIDIDPAEIGHHYPASLGIVADARFTLDALLAALQDQPGDRSSRIQEVSAACDALRKYTHKSLGEAAYLLDAVRDGSPRETVIVADMTMLGYASARYFPVYSPRSFIHPMELCSIGCGLPLALGAKVADPHRPVVALCGDGGFLLNAGELATAVQEKLHVVIVVFNDSAFTAVKRVQQREYNRRYVATDLVGPDYVALARSFGAKGVKAHTPEELRAAVKAALSEDATTLIEVPLPPWHWYSK